MPGKTSLTLLSPVISDSRDERALATSQAFSSDTTDMFQVIFSNASSVIQLQGVPLGPVSVTTDQANDILLFQHPHVIVSLRDIHRD